MKFGEFVPQGPAYAPDAFIAEADTLRTTSQEAADANWQLSRMQAAHQSLEYLAKSSGETGYMERAGRNKVAPEDLNRDFKESLIEPFSEPEYYSVAKIKAERQQKQKFFTQMVEAGPQDTWTQTKHFAAGMVAHILDPAELGLTIATGGILRGVLGAGMAKSAIAKASVNIGENIAGAALAESIVAAAAKDAGTPYTTADFVINTVGSAVAFEGLRFGADRIAKGASGFVKGFRAGYADEIVEAMDRTAVAQMLEGKRVDVTPVTTKIQEEIQLARYERLAETQRVQELRRGELSQTIETARLENQKFLEAIKTAPPEDVPELNLKLAESTERLAKLEDEITNLTPLSDEAVFTAKSGDSISVGEVVDRNGDTVIQARTETGEVIGQLSTVSKDTKLQPKVYVEGSFQRQGVGTALYDYAQNKGYIIPDVAEEGVVRTEAGQAFREARGKGGKTNFESKMAIEPPRQLTPEEEIQTMKDLAASEQDIKRSFLYDEEAMQAYKQLETMETLSPKFAEIKKMEQEYIQQLDELVNQKLLDEDEVLSIREELKIIDQDSQLIEKATKAATVCIGRRG